MAHCAEEYPLVFDAWLEALDRAGATDRKAALMERLKERQGVR